MREEEKLARDVYLNLFDAWGLTVFENISRSEQQHMDAIEKLIDNYGLEDPVVDEESRGIYVDPDLQALRSSPEHGPKVSALFPRHDVQ